MRLSSNTPILTNRRRSALPKNKKNYFTTVFEKKKILSLIEVLNSFQIKYIISRFIRQEVSEKYNKSIIIWTINIC